MKRQNWNFLFFYLLMTATTVTADSKTGASWKLPIELSDQNTKVAFVVDSTWHQIHGVAKNIAGKAWVDKEPEGDLIRAEILFPVADFDTGNSRRDKELRHVMNNQSHPNVVLNLRALEGDCSPAKVIASGVCGGTLVGELKIREVSQNVRIPVNFVAATDGIHVQGDFPIRWAEYNVEDPSILVAKLDQTVVVSFDTIISPSH